MNYAGAMHFALCALLVACGPAARPTDSVRWGIIDPYSGYQTMAVTAAGDVYLARERDDTHDIWLAKRSHDDGSVEWTTTIANAAMPHIATDGDGNVLVTGYVQTDSWYALAAKIDAHGELLWQSHVGDENACGLAIAESTDGRVYVTGSGAASDRFIAALDRDGTPQWSRTFTTGDNGAPTLRADDATVTVTGTIVSNGTFDSTIVNAHEQPFAATYFADGSLGRVSLLPGASPVIDSHGNVTVLAGETLASFDRWGTKRWHVSPTDAYRIAVSPTDAVVTIDQHTLTSYRSDGSFLDDRWLPFEDVYTVAPLASGYVLAGRYLTGSLIALVD